MGHIAAPPKPPRNRAGPLVPRYHLPMARTLLILAVVALTLPSCQQQKTSLAVTAETSQSALNAENDVLGLVERYHAAKKREAEYRPKVNEAELTLQELRRKLAEIRPHLAKAEADLAEANRKKAEAEAARKAAVEATAATTKAVEAATAAQAAKAKELAELEARRKDLEARTKATREFIDHGTRELEVLTKEETRLRDRLNVLRDRVALLKSAHAGFAKRLADIEKEIEALNGGK